MEDIYQVTEDVGGYCKAGDYVVVQRRYEVHAKPDTYIVLIVCDEDLRPEPVRSRTAHGPGRVAVHHTLLRKVDC